MKRNAVLEGMLADVARGVVKHAAGTLMFCPDCGQMLDCSETVTCDTPSGASVTRCGACFDGLVADIARLNGCDSAEVLSALRDVFDGRVLFSARYRQRQRRAARRASMADLQAANIKCQLDQ